MSDTNKPYVELMGAKDVSVAFKLPGQKLASGELVVEDDVLALQIMGDDGVAFIGEPGAIRSLAMKMIRASVLAELKIAENKTKADNK